VSDRPPPPGAGLRALVVDDDLLAAKLCARLCARLGLACDLARDGREALERFATAPPHLVVADLVMPGLDGAALLAQIRRRNQQVPVIIVTAHATVAAAVELLRQGATDLCEKPLVEETFVPRLAQVVEALRLRAEVRELKAQLKAAAGHAPFIGESRALGEVLARLPAIADSDAAVLVYGESGTGKELVARATHYMSRRAPGPFITVNCGAIPDELLESELFGHVRGAFTDARADRPGLAVEAAGGSLFLDEIGEVSPRVQIKLLRFLQEKEVRPVGSNHTAHVDVRIIAATNRDLPAEVAAGRFREDLYYRLSIVPIRLPPLRERPEDIPALCDHFLRRFAAEHHRAVGAIAPLALQKLCGHGWPGNVRELENVIRRAVILARTSVIEPADVVLAGVSAATPAAAGPATTLAEAKRKVIEDFERAYLTAVMAAHGGHVSRAAEAAGKDRKSFWELLKRYGIDRGRFRPGP
jgi:DNA-binding NtrC family response regulator